MRSFRRLASAASGTGVASSASESSDRNGWFLRRRTKSEVARTAIRHAKCRIPPSPRNDGRARSTRTRASWTTSSTSGWSRPSTPRATRRSDGVRRRKSSRTARSSPASTRGTSVANRSSFRALCGLGGRRAGDLTAVNAPTPHLSFFRGNRSQPGTTKTRFFRDGRAESGVYRQSTYASLARAGRAGRPSNRLPMWRGDDRCRRPSSRGFALKALGPSALGRRGRESRDRFGTRRSSHRFGRSPRDR